MLYLLVRLGICGCACCKEKADDEKNAAVIDRGNDMLLHLLKKGGMVSVDMSGGNPQGWFVLEQKYPWFSRTLWIRWPI